MPNKYNTRSLPNLEVLQTSELAYALSIASLPPPRRETLDRQAGISAGGDQELLLCSSQTIGDSMTPTSRQDILT